MEVAWLPAGGGPEVRASAVVRYRPARTYFWSLVWFLQEMVIFAVGARVFWKRPRDESARLFFWLCMVTVGAYMGGYHWTEIVVEPELIYPFAFFALFVPVVSLHFYLVFPRVNPILRSPGDGPSCSRLYGVPTVFLGVLWAFMFRMSLLRGRSGPEAAAALESTLWWIKCLAFGYIAARRSGSSASATSALRASYRSAANQGGAEPGLLDPAGDPKLGDPADRLPPLEQTTGSPSGSGFLLERGVADVRGLAPLYARLRDQHHPLQADGWSRRSTTGASSTSW